MKTVLNVKTDKETRKMAPRFEKFLGGIEKDIRSKKNLSPAFSSAKEAVDYLHLNSNLYS